MLKEIKAKITDKKTGKLKTNFVVAVGLLGILLIFLSGVDNSKSEEGMKNCEPVVNYDTESYKESLELQLQSILSSVSGAGEVSVMISLEGTIEYVYAEEVQSSSQSKDNDKQTSYKNEVVIIENTDGKTALVRKALCPKIAGVLIVCDGGDDVIVSEKLINSASAALGVSTAKIYVAQRT